MESSLTDTGVLSSVVPEQERRALVSQLGALLMPEGTIMVGDFGYSETHPYPGVPLRSVPLLRTTGSGYIISRNLN